MWKIIQDGRAVARRIANTQDKSATADEIKLLADMSELQAQEIMRLRSLVTGRMGNLKGEMDRLYAVEEHGNAACKVALAAVHVATWQRDDALTAIRAAITAEAERDAALARVADVTAERDEAQTDLARIILAIPPGKGMRLAGAVEGVNMLRTAYDAALTPPPG